MSQTRSGPGQLCLVCTGVSADELWSRGLGMEQTFSKFLSKPLCLLFLAGLQQVHGLQNGADVRGHGLVSCHVQRWNLKTIPQHQIEQVGDLGCMVDDHVMTCLPGTTNSL